MPLLLILLVLLFLLLFGGILWSVLKHGLKLTWALLANTILGLVAIFFLNIIGFGIPINTVTLLVSAIFGLLGVAVLALLAIFGML
ncbi:pro-sigmaK processing inhibitor BofA family protein [Candidatus Micrarchaeota archaeon]|nr:pro-sigmaK processing inhibitor BofA family protein [Candidatus Micrarchaeota archaeon]